jgi:HAD superfamily hydrolase (TIGR01509 family)
LIENESELIIKEKDSKYDAVVFDMDGVIFDSERATMNCWIEIAEKYGIKNIEKPYLACTGTTRAKTREIMLAEYGEDFMYDKYAQEASCIYHEKYDGGRLPMKVGVVELLSFLRKEGKKIALASSTRSQTVFGQLRDAKVLDFFDVVICGDMVERSKPAPDIFLKACRELGTKPERTYGIEDSYNGVRALHAGNLRPIMVPDLLPCNEEMQQLTEVILDNLLEVIKYLRNQ